MSLSLLPPQQCPLPLPAPVPAGAGQEPERPLVPRGRAASAARPPATPQGDPALRRTQPRSPGGVS